MPVNQLQLPGRREKRSAMDTILQGLQIANEVFKIPAAYQDLRSKTAQADYNKVKAAGGMTQADLAEKGMSEIPASDLERKPMMVPYAPDYEGPRQLLPSAHYGPKPKLVPVQQADGSLVPTPIVADDAKDKWSAKETKMREDYLASPVTRVSQEALLAGKRAIDILDRPGAKFGPDDITAISGFTKLNDPGGVIREGDINMATKAQGALSVLRAYIESLKTGVALDDTGRKRLRNTIQTLMDTQAEHQMTLDNQFASAAERDGFRPHQVVLSPIDSARGYFSFDMDQEQLDRMKPKPAPPKLSAEKQKELDALKAEMASRRGKK